MIRNRALAAVRNLFVFFLISLLVPDEAHGLSGEEHRAISAAALRLACWTHGLGPRCTEPDPNGILTAAELQALAPLASEHEPGHLSFSEITAYVDYIDDPEKLLHPETGRGPVTRSPCGETDLDMDFLWRLPGRPTARAHAMRNNSAHFQSHLMHLAWSWHRSAVSEAAGVFESWNDGRCFYAALMKSAIAAHYLEDMFAPGHIVAPREGYPDYASNTLHDRYNYLGRIFVVDTDATNRLFRHLAEKLDEADSTGDNASSPPAPTLCGESKEEPVFSFHGSRGQGAEAERQIFGPLLLKEGEARKILHSRILDGSREQKIFFRGDDDLLHPSGFGVRKGSQAGGAYEAGDSGFVCSDERCEEEAKAQRVLLTFTVARAISEVFKARICGYTKDNGLMGEYRWDQMRIAKPGPLDTNIFAKVDLPAAGLVIGSYEPTRMTPLRFGLMGGVEIGTQAFYQSEDQVRGVLGFELFPGIAPPGVDVDDTLVPSFITFALSLGARYRFDENDYGPSFSVGANVIFPRVDLQFALLARVAAFDTGSGVTARFTPEIRVVKTLSFLGLYAGLAYEMRRQDDGDLSREYAITSGAQLVLPWWRLGRMLARLGDSDSDG